MKLKGPTEKTIIENKEGEKFYFCRGHYWKADEEYGGWIPIDLAYGDDITPQNPPKICRFCNSPTLVLRGFGVDCDVGYLCLCCKKINAVE